MGRIRRRADSKFAKLKRSLMGTDECFLEYCPTRPDSEV